MELVIFFAYDVINNVSSGNILIWNIIGKASSWKFVSFRMKEHLG